MPTETPIKIEVLRNAHQQKRNGVRDTIGQCCTCSGHAGRGLSEGHPAEEADPFRGHAQVLCLLIQDGSEALLFLFQAFGTGLACGDERRDFGD